MSALLDFLKLVIKECEGRSAPIWTEDNSKYLYHQSCLGCPAMHICDRNVKEALEAGKVITRWRVL